MNENWKITGIYDIVNEHNKNRILTNYANISAWLNPSNRGNWIIHSVQRLSDNQIFEIGDTFENAILRPAKYVITKIVLTKDNRITIWDTNVFSDYPVCHLDNAIFLSKKSQEKEEEKPIKIAKMPNRIEEYIDQDKNIYSLSEDETYYSIVGKTAKYSENYLKSFCKEYKEEQHKPITKTTKAMKVSVKAAKTQRALAPGDLVHNKKGGYYGILSANGGGAITTTAKIFILHVIDQKAHTTIAPFKYLDVNAMDCELFEGEMTLTNK